MQWKKSTKSSISRNFKQYQCIQCKSLLHHSRIN